MEKLPRSLYPERVAENLSAQIETLEKIISGEIPAWTLTEAERSEILALEDELGQRLETIFAITPQKTSFNLNYFRTEEGASDFKTVTGIDLPHESRSYEDLQKFLYEHTQQIGAVDQKELSQLSGRSTRYREKEVLTSLEATLGVHGEIDTSAIPESFSVSVRTTPLKDYEKTKQLRDFKAELKQRRSKLDAVTESDDYKAVLDGIFELYQRKVNTMIADRAEVFLNYRKKAKVLGEEALSSEERMALSLDSSSGDVPASLARYDKFIAGASDEQDERGWKKQISPELVALADAQEKKFFEAVIEKRGVIAARGLDAEKLSASTIEPDEVQRFCEETLAHYGLLSSVPASEYTPKREGPAADNKWQVIVSDSYRSLRADGKQKVIKCPREPQSIERLLSTAIAHEIEGHAIQHENRSKIPLRLFEKIGSDRSSIFAEAGAMSNQDQVTQEAFGYRSLTHPHYVRAMTVKLEGGNYADCLNAFYLSAIKPYQLQLEQSEIDETAFKKECVKQLELAINRTKRLFRGGASKTEHYPHLPESKSSVYLEQTVLAEQLKARGFEQLLNLIGINMEALVFLLRAKIINLDDIKPPDFYALKIWENVMPQYVQNNQIEKS